MWFVMVAVCDELGSAGIVERVELADTQRVLAVRMLAIVSMMVVAASCGGNDDDEGADPADELQTRVEELEAEIDDLEAENAELRAELEQQTTEPSASAEPPPSTERTTTSARATTTTTPAVQGLLWVPPADDGVGTFTANDTTTRLTAVLAVDTTQHSGEFVTMCQDEIDFEVEYNGWTDPPTYCLYVEWSFDVGANAPVSEFADEPRRSPDQQGRDDLRPSWHSGEHRQRDLCRRWSRVAPALRCRQQRGQGGLRSAGSRSGGVCSIHGLTDGWQIFRHADREDAGPTTPVCLGVVHTERAHRRTARRGPPT
jgi:hypothetical protein